MNAERPFLLPTGQPADAAWLAQIKCPNPKPNVAATSDGYRFVPVPCGLRRCRVCAFRLALVAYEMVRETSERMGNPSVAMTLTSKDPFCDLGRGWAKNVEAVVRAIRRREPDAEYLGFMEWTTGKARTSGGFRRPHCHFLLRGVDTDRCEALEAVIRRVWQARTDANRVEYSPLRMAENGVAYLARHHRKDEQSAPTTFTGRQMRPSRGFYGAPGADVRTRAKEAVKLAHRRARAQEQRRQEVDALIDQGAPPDLAQEIVYGPAEDPMPLPELPDEQWHIVPLRRRPAADA